MALNITPEGCHTASFPKCIHHFPLSVCFILHRPARAVIPSVLLEVSLLIKTYCSNNNMSQLLFILNQPDMEPLFL